MSANQIAELRTGSNNEFSWGSTPFEPHGSIKVNAIDDGAETATITTWYRPIRGLPGDISAWSWSVFESEFADAGGLVIVGGRIIRIPLARPNSGSSRPLRRWRALTTSNSRRR